MKEIKIIGSALPNIPWEDRPESSSVPLWRYSQNPIIKRMLIIKDISHHGSTARFSPYSLHLQSAVFLADIKEWLNDLYLLTDSLPIKQMFIFLCRKMDEYTIVSFHTIDENICQFVFPELIDRLVVCSFERYAMLHTIRYDAIQRSKQSIKEAGNPEMFLGIL